MTREEITAATVAAYLQYAKDPEGGQVKLPAEEHAYRMSLLIADNLGVAE